MNNYDFNVDFSAFFKNIPTDDQKNAIDKFLRFMHPDAREKIFILKGYAGTGKTSLIAALVKMLEVYGHKCLLMAPTGRAAKVLSQYSDHQAYTIHKIIFRQSSIELNASFSINYNKMKNVLFVIDEASMINNNPNDSIMREGLLDSLVNFCFQKQNGCKLLLLGDSAQLPPVGQSISPALSEDAYKKYGIATVVANLKNVVRHEQSSGILYNATVIRNIIENEMFGELPKINFTQFADVVIVPGNELIDILSECYDKDGLDETMVVCRSNKTANIYNNGIRNRILWREDELESGDLIMVAKNNYFWNQQMDSEPDNNAEPKMEFVANGDIAVVQRLRNVRDLFGFRFADCVLKFNDYDDCEIEATVILNTLQAEAPALTDKQQEMLFNNVLEDYYDIPLKKDRINKLKQDPYFNALQIKYAYAVTCHKAQGGQWQNIFVDQGFIPEDTDVRDYCRWLYTAITRATKKLYLVNWQQNQVTT